jgi:hypothetical protein
MLLLTVHRQYFTAAKKCYIYNLTFFIVTFVAGDVFRILIFARFGTLFVTHFCSKHAIQWKAFMLVDAFTLTCKCIVDSWHPVVFPIPVNKQ